MFICSVLSVKSLYKTCISITLLPHTHIYVHKHTHTHFFLSQTLSIYFPVVLFLHTISWETHLHTPKHSHTDSVFPLSMPVTLLSTQLTCVATDTHEYTYRQCFSFNMPATLPSTQLSCVVTHIHTHTDSVFPFNMPATLLSTRLMCVVTRSGPSCSWRTWWVWRGRSAPVCPAVVRYSGDWT